MASLTSPDHKTTHDAAFLSYLVNGGGEKYIHKLVESAQNHSSASPNLEDDRHRIFSRKKKLKDGEIDVFSADKYFNGRIDDSRQSKSLMRTPDMGAARRRCCNNKTGETTMEGINRGGYSRTQTPSSIYSESSGNSQSAFIRKRPQNRSSSSRTQIKAGDNKNFLASLACSCACRDKELVDIHKNHHFKFDFSRAGPDAAMAKSGLSSARQSPVKSLIAVKTNLEPVDFIKINKLKSNGYSPSVKNITGELLEDDGPLAVPMMPSQSATLERITPSRKSEEEGEEEKPRKSLEVFGSPSITENGVTSENFDLDKRLNMLSWDAIPQADEMEIQGPKKSSTDETIKDAESCSDASSDLFEIECISWAANPVLQPREPVSSSFYAPSEASVEWSVVTASMADFSLVSDTEDQGASTGLSDRRVAPNINKVYGSKMSMMQNEMQKKRSSGGGGGLLSGCKSQKSVRVAEDVYKKTTAGSLRVAEAEEGRSVHMPMSYKTMSRFQPDAVRSGLASRRRTDLLYIQ